jgi:5-methylcytosine-specific restriction endonuclease McrA
MYGLTGDVIRSALGFPGFGAFPGPAAGSSSFLSALFLLFPSPGHPPSARGKLRCPPGYPGAQWSHFAAGAEPGPGEVGDVRDTLVLNASFEPLSTVSLRRAVVLVMQDKAVVEQAHPGLRIRAKDVDVPLPQVIRLCRYVRVPFRQRAPWSRRGVLVRDRHRCAYCGRRATTVDHVQPRSRGGGDTWLNTVAACAEDNQRKADRTPEQAGMRLLVRPFEPTPADALLLALGGRERAALPEWLARPA